MVGAERAEEFTYAQQMAALGRDVTVVNPHASPSAEAFAAAGGNFVNAGIEALPRQPGYDVLAEDFPVPIRRLLPQAEAMATERIARIAPGGRWVVATESPEFVQLLQYEAGRQGMRVSSHEVPRHHEATPDSPHVDPRERQRFIITVERPAASAPTAGSADPGGSPAAPVASAASAGSAPAAATPVGAASASTAPAISGATASSTGPLPAPAGASWTVAAREARRVVADASANAAGVAAPAATAAGGAAAVAGTAPAAAPSVGWGERAHQAGALFLPQFFGPDGPAPTYAEQRAAHRARFTADNQPAEGVERANPHYNAPPATPAQILEIQNQILNLLSVRALAEQEAGQQADRAAACEENAGPIAATLADTAASQTALAEHEAAVARRTAANQAQQQRQTEAAGLVAGYPSRATGLAALELPLTAWRGFTSLASHLPGSAGDRMAEMNREADTMQDALIEMGSQMLGSDAAQPAQAAALEGDAGVLSATVGQAQASGGDLQTSADGAAGLQSANQAALAEARRREGAAEQREGQLADAATEREQRADTLAEQLQQWAQQHVAQRQQAIATTTERLQAEGHAVTGSSEP